MRLYENSWNLYKAHSEQFKDDFKFYTDFCKGYTTLELFAGYGRLTNHLINQGIDVEVVENEPKFMAFINLSDSKKHMHNVLEFNTNKKYERIIAAYNSFCLIVDKNDARLFFLMLEKLLTPGGMACLSYFDIDYWTNSNEKQQFKLNSKDIIMTSSLDLSRKNKGFAVWRDTYTINHFEGEDETITFEYPIRIYNDKHPVNLFITDTNLEIAKEVRNFGLHNSEVVEEGWVDYVLQKKY